VNMMSSTRSRVLSLTSGEVRAKKGRRLGVLSLTETSSGVKKVYVRSRVVVWLAAVSEEKV
jgi:hypothetical protein